MRKRLSEMVVFVDLDRELPSGYRVEPGSGPYPYYGKASDRGLTTVDDWNIDGIHLVIADGVRSRSQKNTFLTHVVQGRAFVDSGYLAYRIEAASDAAFLQQVLANTDTTGILLDYFSPNCHIDLDALMGIEFYYPGEQEAAHLARAFSSCNAIAQGAADFERNALLFLDDAYTALINRSSSLCSNVSPRTVAFREAVLPSSGRDLPLCDRVTGCFPIVSPFGVMGMHNRALASGPAIILGLKGSLPWILWSEKPCWPVGKSMYVDDSSTDLPLATVFCALRAWANEIRAGDISDFDHLKQTLCAVSLPTADGAVERFERAARAVLHMAELYREKAQAVTGVRKNYLDLKATGLM